MQPPPEPQPIPPAIAVTVDGVVLRSDGHGIAWVNGGETASGSTTAADNRIESDHAPDGRLRIRLPDRRGSAVLKPGQTMNGDGRVLDAFERDRGAGTAPPLGRGAT